MDVDKVKDRLSITPSRYKQSDTLYRAIMNDTVDVDSYMKSLAVDKSYEDRLSEPGLVDNTLDFIPGAKLGSIGRGLGNTSKGIRSARELRDKTDIGLADSLKDTFTGQSLQVKNAILGTKSKRVKPTYREAGIVDPKSNGFMTSNAMPGSPGNIVVRSSLGDVEKGMAKRHEFRHASDKRSNGRLFTDSKLVRTAGKKGDRDKWASRPEEVSAQLREIKYLDSLLKSDKRGTLNKARLRMYKEDLVESVAPFKRDFDQRYDN